MTQYVDFRAGVSERKMQLIPVVPRTGKGYCSKFPYFSIRATLRSIMTKRRKRGQGRPNGKARSKYVLPLLPRTNTEIQRQRNGLPREPHRNTKIDPEPTMEKNQPNRHTLHSKVCTQLLCPLTNENDRTVEPWQRCEHPFITRSYSLDRNVEGSPVNNHVDRLIEGEATIVYYKQCIPGCTNGTIISGAEIYLMSRLGVKLV